jgi:CheY-like chemotaxis protein
MRRCLLIVVVSLFALPATAFASAGAVGDGSLSIANANVNTIIVVGHGLIYGYVDQGAVTVFSYIPDDGSQPQLQISGATLPSKPTIVGTRYAGSALRFLISGTYALKFEGSGINVSGVGKGTVTANGADITTASSDGTLAVNGGRPQSLGRNQTVASFGYTVAGGGDHVDGDDDNDDNDDNDDKQAGAVVSAAGTNILVVEDETSIASFVALYLKNAGYDVRTAATGIDALRLAEAQAPSLVVLDLMLPDIDGLEVCKRLRQGSDVPILMLTARDEDVDKIIGLEVGADDYLTKPFNPRELVARIKSILRRSATPSGATCRPR